MFSCMRRIWVILIVFFFLPNRPSEEKMDRSLWTIPTNIQNFNFLFSQITVDTSRKEVG